MSENEQIIRENQETLETLAQSDLRSSKWASKLLESIETQSSYSENEQTENNVTPTVEPENDNQKGIWAY